MFALMYSQVRLARLLAHDVDVAAEERVHHDRDPAKRRIVSGRRPRLAVARHLGLQPVGILIEQMGQEIGPGTAGPLERPRVARRRDPDGKLRLHRARVDPDLDALSGTARRLDRVTAPEAAHHVERLEHRVVAPLVAIRRHREVVRVPARRHRDTDPAARQVVDKRPVFGDAKRMVQRQDDAAGHQPHAAGLARQRRLQHRRVRIQPAEIGVVPFRRPHAREAVPIGIPRRLDHQPVAVAAIRRLAAVEEHHAELRRRGRDGSRRARRLRPVNRGGSSPARQRQRGMHGPVFVSAVARADLTVGLLLPERHDRHLDECLRRDRRECRVGDAHAIQAQRPLAKQARAGGARQLDVRRRRQHRRLVDAVAVQEAAGRAALELPDRGATKQRDVGEPAAQHRMRLGARRDADGLGRLDLRG